MTNLWLMISISIILFYTIIRIRLIEYHSECIKDSICEYYNQIVIRKNNDMHVLWLSKCLTQLREYFPIWKKILYFWDWSNKKYLFKQDLMVLRGFMKTKKNRRIFFILDMCVICLIIVVYFSFIFLILNNKY